MAADTPRPEAGESGSALSVCKDGFEEHNTSLDLSCKEGAVGDSQHDSVAAFDKSTESIAAPGAIFFKSEAELLPTVCHDDMPPPEKYDMLFKVPKEILDGATSQNGIVVGASDAKSDGPLDMLVNPPVAGGATSALGEEVAPLPVNLPPPMFPPNLPLPTFPPPALAVPPGAVPPAPLSSGPVPRPMPPLALPGAGAASPVTLDSVPPALTGVLPLSVASPPSLAPPCMNPMSCLVPTPRGLPAPSLLAPSRRPTTITPTNLRHVPAVSAVRGSVPPGVLGRFQQKAAPVLFQAVGSNVVPVSCDGGPEALKAWDAFMVAYRRYVVELAAQAVHRVDITSAASCTSALGSLRSDMACVPHLMGQCQRGLRCPDRHPAGGSGQLGFYAPTSDMKRKVCDYGSSCALTGCPLFHPMDSASRKEHAEGSNSSRKGVIQSSAAMEEAHSQAALARCTTGTEGICAVSQVGAASGPDALASGPDALGAATIAKLLDDAGTSGRNAADNKFKTDATVVPSVGASALAAEKPVSVERTVDVVVGDHGAVGESKSEEHNQAGGIEAGEMSR